MLFVQERQAAPGKLRASWEYQPVLLSLAVKARAVVFPSRPAAWRQCWKQQLPDRWGTHPLLVPTGCGSASPASAADARCVSVSGCSCVPVQLSDQRCPDNIKTTMVMAYQPNIIHQILAKHACTADLIPCSITGCYHLTTLIVSK